MSDQPTISHGEIAGDIETASDNFTPPLPQEHDRSGYVSEVEQVQQLEEFLKSRFPAERDRTNRQAPESPVATAIRLLSAMSASGPTQRCDQEYCNKATGHLDDHGWVHYQ